MTECDVPFSVDDLVDKLLPHVSTRGWEFIGRRALARSKRVAVPTFMYVAFEFEITDLDATAGSGL